MKPTSIVTLVTATLLCVGMAYWIGAHEKRNPPWPKPTPPPPPSPIYHESRERAPTTEEIDREARGHEERMVLEIERALAIGDPQQRETAFTFLLPELIQIEPRRVVAMLARQKPGNRRDTLRTEVARQWIAWDADAAIAWMMSLEQDEQRASAQAAAAAIAPHDPAGALKLAKIFGVGGEEGSRRRRPQAAR